MAQRIEFPAEFYWKANDGKRFPTEEECLKYEYLIAKYHTADRHRTIDDGEDKTNHFYYIKDIEEVREVCQLSRYVHGYTPRIPVNCSFADTWIWIEPDFDGYGAVNTVGLLDDFISLQRDYMNDYFRALSEAEALLNG